MSFTIDNIRTLLIELNDAMILEGAQPAELLICGGAALALQGLGTRVTRDIDVLGAWLADGMQVAAIGEFPTAFARAIERVANAHPELAGMKPDWVNLGPKLIVEFGLPEGYASRVTAFRVGDRLTLHRLGRVDLIARKAIVEELGHEDLAYYL